MTGGSGGTGGAATGGKATGGSTSTGGNANTGGNGTTGGNATGGNGTTGGNATGGNGTTGGNATGGQRTGGSGGAGAATGGGSGTTGGTSGGTGGCIICDDFDSSSTLDAAKWTIDASAGAAVGKAEIVASGAHGSAKAVKVSGGYIKVGAKSGLFASVGSTFYVRLNMKFDMAQPSDHVTYLMFDDGSHQLRLGAQNGGMIWNYDSTDSILPDYNAAAMSLKPGANEWHCFEFEIDSTTPELHVWMDGTESPTMLLDKTATQGIDDRWMRDMAGWKPKITNFSFGAGYPTPGKVTLWVDDIAIANAPIGCKF